MKAPESLQDWSFDKTEVLTMGIRGLLPHPFSSGHRSWTLVVRRSLSHNEGLRLKNTVRKAIDDIADATNAEPFMVAVYVTPHVPFVDAKRWVAELLAAARPASLVGVLLYRATVASTDLAASASRAVVHQVGWVGNPAASESTSAVARELMPFRAEVPIGGVSEGDTALKLMIGDRQVELDGYYAFIRGDHVYHVHKAGTSVTVVLPQFPNINTSVLITGLPGASPGQGMVIGAHRPPTDELLLA